MAYRFKPPKAGCKTPGQATAAKLDLYVTVHRGDLSRFFRRGEEPDSRGDVLTEQRDNIPKLVADLFFGWIGVADPAARAGGREGPNEIAGAPI